MLCDSLCSLHNKSVGIYVIHLKEVSQCRLPQLLRRQFSQSMRNIVPTRTVFAASLQGCAQEALSAQALAPKYKNI